MSTRTNHDDGHDDSCDEQDRSIASESQGQSQGQGQGQGQELDGLHDPSSMSMSSFLPLPSPPLPPSSLSLSLSSADDSRSSFSALATGLATGLTTGLPTGLTTGLATGQAAKDAGKGRASFAGAPSLSRSLAPPALTQAVPVAEPTSRWSALQARAISLVLDGKNVVITGPAGSGKSAVTDFLRLELARRGAKVAVAGTTGTSAYNIGGKTIHSFLRVGIKIDEQTKVRAGAELASFCL